MPRRFLAAAGRVFAALDAWLSPLRFFLVPALLFAFFVYIFANLLHLHLGGRPTRNKTVYSKELPSMRGVIYDRNSNPIAVNQSGWRIFLDPHAAERPGQDAIATCKRVSQLTGKDAAAIYRELCDTNLSRYVVQGITFDPGAIDLATNKSLYVNGVNLEPVERRLYPQGRRFSHILGHLSGRELVGRNGGIEQKYNEELTGTDGFIRGVKANNGREIRSRRISTVEPIDGASVYLTVDQNIQHIVYGALARAMEEWNADGARAIVQEVETGAILAMVSLPDYDPENWKESTPEKRKNRTVTDLYDPGSTMKSVTIASALNEGIIATNTVYDAGNGMWRYGGHGLRDHVSGKIDVATILAKSSNIGSAKIALDLGNKRFESYLRAFCFAKRSGIDLPGESSGLLPPSERWEPVKPTRIAIGQGISVTPIQMIGAYSAIANGGRVMRPYVMDRIVSAKGEILRRNKPMVLATPVKPEVCAQLRAMLSEVVSARGTARRARIPGYTAGGKTGTAQITKPGGGYYANSHWASFIGFVPAEKPVFSVLVLLDNPTKPGKSHDGGVSAAPVFSEIASATAQYLSLPSARQ